MRLLVAEGLFILESFITVTKLKQTELYLPLNMAESLFLQCNIPSTEIQLFGQDCLESRVTTKDMPKISLQSL